MGRGKAQKRYQGGKECRGRRRERSRQSWDGSGGGRLLVRGCDGRGRGGGGACWRHAELAHYHRMDGDTLLRYTPTHTLAEPRVGYIIKGHRSAQAVRERMYTYIHARGI